MTAQAQPGNPRPRLFRLPARSRADQPDGLQQRRRASAAAAARAAGRARRRRGRRGRQHRQDQARGRGRGARRLRRERRPARAARRLPRRQRQLAEHAGAARPAGGGHSSRPLLAAVRAACDLASPLRRVPLLVKIAPDLADEDVDAVADLALELGLDGIIATNTTIARDGPRAAPRGRGRARGAPAGSPARRSRRARSRCCGGCAPASGGRLTLIAVGGIETADDAWERLRAGATLVQGYTGFIYGGPGWPRRLQRELAARVRAAGPRLDRTGDRRRSSSLSSRASARPRAARSSPAAARAPPAAAAAPSPRAAAPPGRATRATAACATTRATVTATSVAASATTIWSAGSRNARSTAISSRSNTDSASASTTSSPSPHASRRATASWSVRSRPRHRVAAHRERAQDRVEHLGARRLAVAVLHGVEHLVAQDAHRLDHVGPGPAHGSVSPWAPHRWPSSSAIVANRRSRSAARRAPRAPADRGACPSPPAPRAADR